MPIIKSFSLIFLVVLFITSQNIRAQIAVSDKEVPNFAQVNANLYRGGQPTEAGIRKLSELGIKTIVYLRGADENARTEERWAKDAGIEFKSFPLSNWHRPKDAEIKEILAFIDASPNQPVLVHCKRGADRTGTVIAVYRISHDGKTAKEALAEAKKYNLGWWQFWMKDYINDYYRDYKQ